MTKQIDLIGAHPTGTDALSQWLISTDIPATATSCHRQLLENSAHRGDSINWLAERLVAHHYTAFRIDRLKKLYGTLGYEKYAEQNRRLPVADRVKKGNATEVLLTEYIQSSLGKTLIKVFKLKYNPNVDQAIKGDDTLMVDLFDEGGKENLKIYLGESKFRKTPTKAVVEQISSSLSKDKMPLSYSFMVEEIAKSDEALAAALDNFIVEDVKNRGNLVYTGLLLSSTEVEKYITAHLDNNNPTMIMISIGIDNPEELINDAFVKANELLEDPTKL